MKNKNQITNFDEVRKRRGFEALSLQISTELAAFAKEYGVKVSMGKIKYETGYADFTVRLSVINAVGEAETPATAEWKAMCTAFGFEVSDLFRKFTFKGQVHKIVGLKSNCRNPILIEREDGKRFRFDRDLVKTSLKHYAI